jgi:hypothetical protein
MQYKTSSRSRANRHAKPLQEYHVIRNQQAKSIPSPHCNHIIRNQQANSIPSPHCNHIIRNQQANSIPSPHCNHIILATPPPAPRMYHAPAWTYNALETMDPPCSLASLAGKQRPYRQGMVEGACGIYPASSTS